MNKEQQRTAIAKACGEDNDSIVRELIPDYLNDLNVMHEAEKTLIDEQWYEYREHLRTVVLGGIRYVSQWCKADIHATASQRAEAFLRTIDKWEESK